MNATKVAVLFALGTVLLLGCRNVWTKPGATAAAYKTDFWECRYGGPPPPLEGTWDAQHRQIHPGWSDCMEHRGWTRRVGAQSSKPWADE